MCVMMMVCEFIMNAPFMFWTLKKCAANTCLAIVFDVRGNGIYAACVMFATPYVVEIYHKKSSDILQ